MSGQPRVRPDPALELLEVYDAALPHVHGYLLSRCRNRTLAQDLTAETFLAAVIAARQQPVPPITTGWLIGVARHKLADHWRRVEREQRGLALVRTTGYEINDPWDVEIDTVVAHQVLDALDAHHRAALTLRYLDGLPVAQVAEHLGRTCMPPRHCWSAPAPHSAQPMKTRRVCDDRSAPRSIPGPR